MTPAPARSQGFTLVEVMLALLVVSVMVGAVGATLSAREDAANLRGTVAVLELLAQAADDASLAGLSLSGWGAPSDLTALGISGVAGYVNNPWGKRYHVRTTPVPKARTTIPAAVGLGGLGPAGTEVIETGGGTALVVYPHRRTDAYLGSVLEAKALYREAPQW